MEKKIKKIMGNKIKCKHCGDIIESKYRHDFVKCSCGKVAVDGGHAYLKRMGDPKDWEDLSFTRVSVKIYGYENYERIKNVYSTNDAYYKNSFICPKCKSNKISILKGDGEKIIGCDIIALICDNCKKVYEFEDVKYKKGSNHE